MWRRGPSRRRPRGGSLDTEPGTEGLVRTLNDSVQAASSFDRLMAGPLGDARWTGGVRARITPFACDGGTYRQLVGSDPRTGTIVAARGGSRPWPRSPHNRLRGDPDYAHPSA